MDLTRSVVVDGVEVRYDVRGAGERTLVLIHGHQAHHVWWHGVEKVLARRWRLVLLDLSGHGDSGRRDLYDGQVWAEEVVAVLHAVGGGPAVLVGHSMGGRVAVTTAFLRPDLALGVMMLDSAIRPDGRRRLIPWDPAREARVHATRSALEARFRLVPAQPDPPPDLLGPVTRYSVRQGPDGWTWKYDQRGLPGMDEVLVQTALASTVVPVRYVRAAASSVVGPEVLEHLQSLNPPGGLDVMSLPGLHHHLVLEDPEVCAQEIERFAVARFG